MIKRLSYYLFLWSTTSRLFPYALILIVSVGVAVIGMGAYFFGLFSLQALEAEGIDNILGGGVIDSFWWSMKHILDPGSISENYGAPMGVILFALFNSVMGLIITGALIGFIVSAIQSTMENAKMGSGFVRESGHYLVLGWNRKGTSILELLSKFGNIARVVVLTEMDISELRTDIRRGPRGLRNLKLLPMQGSIWVNSELRRVAAANASHIILLAETNSGTSADVTTIKTLTLLNTPTYQKNSGRRVKIVAEIVNKENTSIAAIASKHQHPIVSSSDFVSKTMVQCARYPGYANVYSELFASGKYRIENKSIANLEGTLFGQLSGTFNNGIIIGISWMEAKPDHKPRQVSVLNPEPDYDLSDEDQLIVLVRLDEELNFVSDQILELPQAYRHQEIVRPNVLKVLILGCNVNLGLIVTEVAQHAATNIEVMVACANAEEEEALIRQRYENLFSEHLNLRFEEFDLAESWSLEESDPWQYDVIFIVADESDGTIDADSKTIMLLLLLGELRDKKPLLTFPPVVAELLHSESKELCEGTPLTDAVDSTEIISVQLAQLVREPFLETVYKELLNAGGIEIGLRPVTLFVKANENVTMSEVNRQALSANEIPLGYQRENEEVIIDPAKNEPIVFGENDQIIVLAQQLYT
jgi:hypothetical protein|tara:strand:+ start:4101 stop:6035 length:1935 start_codon:yes stop_codon:yes gene_type:complete